MVTERAPALRSGARLVLRVTGAGLLVAAAAVHLDLYLTGYRTIPTIGWLFLLQVVVGFAVGLLVLATGSRLAAAVGALFALSTLGGYLLSVQFGLFGFREVRTTAGIAAGLLEVLAFAALAVLAATPARAGGGVGGLTAGLAAAGVSLVSLVSLGLLGGALAGAGAPAGSAAYGGGGQPGNSASGGLRTTTIDGTRVLTNAAGRTLYWFAADTPTRSACTGSCAAYWPPVTGPLTAGPGVTGRLGTIQRPGGSRQETFNGHPLYTYIGDTGPGQAHGNNLNLNGGRWHEMVVTG